MRKQMKYLNYSSIQLFYSFCIGSSLYVQNEKSEQKRNVSSIVQFSYFTVYSLEFPDRWGVKNEKTNEIFNSLFSLIRLFVHLFYCLYCKISRYCLYRRVEVRQKMKYRKHF